MAQVFAASIYRIDSAGGTTQIRNVQGASNGFSSANVHIYPLSPAVTCGDANVACNSVIEVPAQGLNQPSTKYYTPATVSTLVTAANA